MNMIVGLLVGSAGAVVLAVLTGLLTKEAEGLIDALPGLMLRLARRRLPDGDRDDLYEEWAAELHVALHHSEGRPLTRLLLGVRYSAGLLRTARRIADELGPARRTSPARWDTESPADVLPDRQRPAPADPVPVAVPQPPRGGPTVLRILLGVQLRRLREQRGLTQEEAGEAIRGSHVKISRMELGRVRFRPRDIADLLALYGITDAAERQSLLSLAETANDPGWWHRYSDLLPSWFEVYIGLEEAASAIRTYEVQFVPGLLQTEAYARGATLLGHPDALPQEIERRVALRMRRQALLTADDSPRFWAVIDETALRRPLGGVPVMREQIRHLIEITDLPNVTVQVVPFWCGGHAAAGGSFTLLRFAEPDLPDVVYLEQLTSALYLDKREDIDDYTAVMERLCIDAVPADATRDILARLLREL